MRRLSFSLFLLTLLIFGLILALVSWNLRRELREQFIYRNAEFLHPLTLLQVERARETLGETLPFEDASVLSSILETGDMTNVETVRVFDSAGFLLSDDDLTPVYLTEPDLAQARQDQLIARYHPSATWDSFYVSPKPAAGTDGAPFVEVLIPIAGEAESRLGIVQYVLKGDFTREEFSILDRKVLTMAGLAFLGGALALGALFFWIFRKLEESLRLLENRETRLIEANHELAFAAKSSAVGPISAHLIHGLKNPLAALKSWLSDPHLSIKLPEDELNEARSCLQRMEQMVRDIVSVLQDEETVPAFDYDLTDLRDVLANKTQLRARARKITLDFHEPIPDESLDGRQGNLLVLILVNLIENAIDASPDNSTVGLEFQKNNKAFSFLVQDQGPGIPKATQEQLFRPLRTRKKEGSGIGLAISQEMAKRINARIQLQSSSSSGSCFQVILDPATPNLESP
ncbi:MAG: HAMP domain-containing sensor histidine kinase [Verrucomicrobiota bacterium]